MDGIPSELYKSMGDVKSKNPDLKLVISIGGWTFRDPGDYQAIFPTMVSNSANRANFITNLLKWLAEYGYDGVDFDWEYPGVDDHGGSADNGVNYTTFLKELREAIDASGKDFIVMFTAPISYWYLKNFDLANMMQYVDWVDILSYDLHGVWDSDDQWIGNQVLAHTNITEIASALDLFWRVDVDPASIVLGLGFYARAFQLTDPSCWKPECAFSSAGEAGECTSTAGILSYREIQNIIQSTGATAYTATDAAVNYLTYGIDSWVSYDDSVTFAAKFEYAESLGLGGLIAWAIDLDDNGLTALLAMGGEVSESGVDFSLVPLEYRFPSDPNHQTSTAECRRIRKSRSPSCSPLGARRPALMRPRTPRAGRASKSASRSKKESVAAGPVAYPCTWPMSRSHNAIPTLQSITFSI
nr:putative chitinase 18 [Pestalotiopsis sp. CR013]